MGVYADTFFKHIRPVKKPDLVQFSEKNIFLSKKISAETGRYNINRTPYLRDVMQALADKETDVVVLMKSAQVGATQLGMNFLAYSILYDPAPILYVLPTLDIAKKVSKQRIHSLFDTTESLRGIVKDPRERDSGNTIFTKEFPNGILIIAGANSPAGLRSMPVRYLIADEIDAYPESAGDEGSPLDLALKRTMTFKNRKVFLISTPTNKGNSNIDYWYSISSQHKYYVPCPYCNHEQLLLFANLIFTHDENNNVTDVYYKCSHCGEKIYEKQKQSMLQKGRWIAKNNKKDIKVLWINGLYSVWLTWREIAEEFLRVRNNTVALKTFVNTVLAEVWEDEAEKIDNVELSERRKDLSKIPADCIVLTAGCDVQKDRIEISVIGWGEGYTSWVVDHIVVYGDTTIEDTYKDLELALQRQYEGVNNNIYNIVAACIDTGYATQAVYRFLKRNQSRRWWGIKGSAIPWRLTTLPTCVHWRLTCQW
jgi:phage terminase large subunit GpA-like protein